MGSCRYIHKMQEVAQGMSHRFQDAMAPILQDVLLYFLPFLLSPPETIPPNSLPLDDAAGDGTRNPPPSPGGSGGILCTQAPGSASARSELEECEGPSAIPEAAASTLGTCESAEGPFPHIQGWDDDGDAASLKEKLHQTGNRTDGTAPPPRMHPLLLHFDDGPVEAAFKAAQGLACRPVLLLACVSALHLLLCFTHLCV